MKVCISFLLSLLICQVVFSQGADDEGKVRVVIQKMEEAWNIHDYSFSGKYDLFAPEAVLVNPVGMYWKNKPEIIKGIHKLGEIKFKYTSAKYTIKDIHFLSPTVALVVLHSVDRVEQDYNYPDGTKGGSKGEISEGMYTFTLVKRNQDWKITSLHITHIDVNALPLDSVKRN